MFGGRIEEGDRGDFGGEKKFWRNEAIPRYQRRERRSMMCPLPSSIRPGDSLLV